MQNKYILENRLIDIYSNFKNYDLFEWSNFLMYGGFPSLFSDIGKRIVSMVDSVVERDLAESRNIKSKTKDLAFQILNFLAFQNQSRISKGFISNFFNVNPALVSKVLNDLEKTQLIFHIEAFSSSFKRTTKPHKYFFKTSSIKHNLAFDLADMLEDKSVYMEKLLENHVASSFHSLGNNKGINYKIYYDDSKKVLIL